MRTSTAFVVSLLVFGCMLCSSCTTLSDLPLDKGDSDARRYAENGDLKHEVDVLAQPLVDTGMTPGMVVGVLMPDGAMRFFGYGVADKTSGVAPDADTVFSVGSLSKGFLAAITSQLVNDGMLSWKTTLKELLPAGTPLSPDAEKITIEQLATHTSGLPRQPMTPETLLYFVRYLFTGESFYRQYDQAFIRQYLSTYKAYFGHEPRYSNVGYGLLGYVVEMRTGRSLEQLFEQNLRTPLGLAHTAYDNMALPPQSLHAHGYSGDQPKFVMRGRSVPDWKFTDVMKGSAAIQSSARDLLTFAAAHLRHDGTQLSAALEDTLRVRYPRQHHAAAVAWSEDSLDGQQISYQIGVVAGYTSYIGIDTRHHTAVVVLQNSFNWSSNCGHQILVRMGRAMDIRDASIVPSAGARRLEARN